VQSVMSNCLKFVFSYGFGVAVGLISGRKFEFIFLSQFEASLDISIILILDFVLQLLLICQISIFIYK